MNQKTPTGYEQSAPADAWIVHKFGGTSLADAQRYTNVANILADRRYGPQGVVVSAARGVTDTLLRLIEQASAGDVGWEASADALRERHTELAEALLEGEAETIYLQTFAADLADIRDIARSTALLGAASRTTYDTVSGYGEVWSARLLSALLRQLWGDTREVRFLDARAVLVIARGEMGPVVDWQQSAERLERTLPENFAGTVVITGYVARDSSGRNATLGRNGSDFSASIFGALLKASQIHIWTDVDGVMTADPRWVSEVRVIEELSYNEAMELAYFGAKVLHPQTMAPAIAGGIPIFIRNTFAPELPGTRISATPDPGGEGARVKGITSINGMAVVNLEGAGMIGVPGTAQRLFGALSGAGISVVMISQGSSEHSICFAVSDADAERARDIVMKTFHAELEANAIQRVSVQRGLSVLAVVGDSMAGAPGVAAKVFGSLGDAGVNVRAIAQGSSERNISAVIDSRDTTRALRAVHSRFYLSPQTLSIGVIGAGTVGRVFLNQLASQSERLRAQFNLDLRVRALANSRRMWLAEERLDLAAWDPADETGSQPADLQRLADHVQADHMPHAVIVDCTASAAVARCYPAWLRSGIHVITPNKKAGSDDYARWLQVRDSARAGEARYFYETTVGAGLPILQTLQDLRETGDRIVRVQGILSGTLAYLFNTFDGSVPFSQIVRAARDSGYTEPDPRDDLSGMDVARKVVILARQMGLKLDLSDVSVESLVPDGLQGGDADAFLDALPAHDEAMTQRYRSALRDGKVLRYVAQLDQSGKADVALRALPADHSFAHINLTDNIVQFETERYCNNPLVVQGPGAGPDVTAAGVFADLLRLASHLGAAV